jgi:Icc-related predicted phosphoesterase
MTKLVLISDTHLTMPDLPQGEILVHCGDATYLGGIPELTKFLEWLGAEPFEQKYFVPGNHDHGMEDHRSLMRDIAGKNDVIILDNDEVEYGGFKIFGSPVQPVFHDWAFNRSNDFRENFWKHAPACDILFTHCPPKGILDVSKNLSLGCVYLRQYVDRVKPKLHAFGHIHSGYGQVFTSDTTFINASILDDNYKPANKPIVIDL